MFRIIPAAFRFSTIGILILVLLPVFTACKNKHAEIRKELIIGVSQDYRATDVFSHKGFNCLVFETLIKRGPDGEIHPFLAESWEKSPDSRQYTFHLKKGIMFSDGTPLTAGQVKEAMFYKHRRKRNRGPARNFKGSPPSQYTDKKPQSPQNTQNPELDRSYGTFDNERYNLPNWSSFSSIDVIDDYTIRFNLPKPYTLFLTELATSHSYPVLKIDASEPVTGYLGTGPYTIDEHKRIQYMVLKKNKYYWQGPVNIEQIRLRVIPDAETRAIALEAGEIDITGYDHFDKIPNESVTRLKQLPFITIKTMGNIEQPTVSFLAVNYKKGVFENPLIRRALAKAINVKQIDVLMSETGRVIDGPFPQEHELYHPDIKRPGFDKAAAKQLLSEAGWKEYDRDGILTKEGKPLTMTLTFSSFDPQYKVIAEMIQAQLRDIGINMTLNMVELGTHITIMRNTEYDLAFWPMMRYHMFFYTRHPSWLNVYNSPGLDAFFTQYLHGDDTDKQKAAARKTQELIHDSFVFPLFFERFDVVAWNHTIVENFLPIPIGWDLSMNVWQANLKQ